MILSDRMVEPESNQSASEMSPACEAAFRQIIARRTGIVLQNHQISNLRNTISSGCAQFGLSSCEAYLQHIEETPSLTPPLEYLVAGITVGESYFFRDSEQIALLRDHLLPDMIAEKRRNSELSIRIWSAGCSQGQEIYSVAMLLWDLIPDIAEWHVHLLGTDINTEVLSKAVSARYGEWSFRVMSPQQKARWFTTVGSNYEIHAKLKKLVRFSYLNLTEDIFPSILNETNALDLILCRNVFIYLDRDVIRRTMGRFADCLVDGGVLMLGASDPIDRSTCSLEWHQSDRTSFFRKQLMVPAPIAQSSRSVRSSPMMVPQAKAQRFGHQPQPEPGQEISTDKHDNLKARLLVATLLQSDDWDGAVKAIEGYEKDSLGDSVLMQMKAQALASLGHTEQALSACTQSLALDTLNAHAYLIRALVLAELDQSREAEDALRSALYINRSFVEAHYEFGMLKIRSGQVDIGIKSLENALKLAMEGDPERLFHNAGGMTYGRFVHVLKSEIEIYRNVGELKVVKQAPRSR